MCFLLQVGLVQSHVIKVGGTAFNPYLPIPSRKPNLFFFFHSSDRSDFESSASKSCLVFLDTLLVSWIGYNVLYPICRLVTVCTGANGRDWLSFASCISFTSSIFCSSTFKVKSEIENEYK